MRRTVPKVLEEIRQVLIRAPTFISGRLGVCSFGMIQMAHQRNRRILAQSGFLGSFVVLGSRWSWIIDLDVGHPKGTHPWCLLKLIGCRKRGGKLQTSACRFLLFFPQLFVKNRSKFRNWKLLIGPPSTVRGFQPFSVPTAYWVIQFKQFREIYFLSCSLSDLNWKHGPQYRQN